MTSVTMLQTNTKDSIAQTIAGQLLGRTRLPIAFQGAFMLCCQRQAIAWQASWSKERPPMREASANRFHCGISG